tara:strand:- start:651 stop:1637 length:987 start_codon:yes stop_codon:yes gene_type:complete
LRNLAIEVPEFDMQRAAGVLLITLFFVLVPVASLHAQGSGENTYIKTTAWGDPDLAGIWSYASLTPLQRPASLGNKEFYTADEAAQINASSREESDPTPGSVGAYNAGWFDKGDISSDLRTSLIVEPADGRLPLRAEAKEKLDAEAAFRKAHETDSYIYLTNWDRCITYHGVPPISSGYNNAYQIVQTPDHIAIYVEMIHDVRIIPLDKRPRLNDKIRQWNGDSRAYWEGNTLVVETANFSDKTVHRFPSTRNTRTVERFTRTGEDMIDYRFTIEDDELYSSPWTAVRPMPRQPDYTLYEYACHEGNYAMKYILRGARVEEQRAAEQR